LQNPKFELIYFAKQCKKRETGGHFWHDGVNQNDTVNACSMNNTKPEMIMHRWNVIQHELIPAMREQVGTLTPKLERLIHTLEWVRIEEFTKSAWCGIGRPPAERAWLANAFVAKSVLGLGNTRMLIERLQIDRSLRRICGFSMYVTLPSESTFSRAFEEFATSCLAERVHEALIKEHLGEQLIGHISRDGTAIPARERPFKSQARYDRSAPKAKPAKRGRPRRGEVRPPAKESALKIQRNQTLKQMRNDIPQACDRGTKCNAQGFKTSWNGYKLHLDTADCGVPISALLSSASVHDSRACIPLALMSQQRVSNLYDVMDAAYCSKDLREHSSSLGHVPLIDHNPRGGEKIEFCPAQAVRYNERTVAERSNARLKDEFGARNLMVKGASKVMGHLMFGVLALSAGQLMRLRQ